MSERKYTYQFSMSFKQKVISEIESGQLSIAEASKVYDIKSKQTIYLWLRKFGRQYLINRGGRIVSKEKKDRIAELEHQKQELESALAKAHLKNLCLESLIECVEEQYKIDVKKNFGPKASKRALSK